MDKLIKWLKCEGITVTFLDIENDGFCFVNENLIIVDEKLDERNQEKSIRHELRHFDHKDFIALYDKFVYHSKMEDDANDYMISSFIEDNGNQYNYSMLIEKFGIGIGYDTRYQKLT